MDKKTALKQLRLLDKYSSKMRLAAEGWDKPWKILIATILSARTRDEVTIKICKELFLKYQNINKLAKANLKNIQGIIRPINFYKNKSKSVLNCAKQLIIKHKGNIPKDFEDLIGLSGVGRKTANVYLSEMGKDSIGVDTHVSYISQKLGWTFSNKPHKIEEDLKRLFPKPYWNKINPILVRFGKTYLSRRKKNEMLVEIKNIK